MDLELELFGDLKDKSGSSSVGKVYMLSLSSQPVDHEDAATGERQKVSDFTILFLKFSCSLEPKEILKTKIWVLWLDCFGASCCLVV